MNINITTKIWIYTILIIVVGLVALYSASYNNVRVEQKVFYDQLYFSMFGLGLLFLVSKIDYRKFYDIAYALYFLNLFLLLIVLFSSRHILGARRWLELGIINFQPSELAKLSLILVLARYLCNVRPVVKFDILSRAQKIFREILFPLLFTALYMIFIFKQPDLGTALLIFGIFFVMLYISNLEIKYVFSLLIIFASFLPFVWHILKPYQKDRLLVFLNPNIDPLGAGYTIIQSKIAVGSGQLLGKGWLSGTQNQLNFLPERHTDFIFSVIGEEWGLVGTLIVLYCFFCLIYNLISVVQKTKDRFGVLAGVGIIAILSLQVVINIGMVIGMFPIVGITLPFISYGRSSFLVFIIAIGFILSLSKRRSFF